MEERKELSLNFQSIITSSRRLWGNKMGEKSPDGISVALTGCTVGLTDEQASSRSSVL